MDPEEYWAQATRLGHLSRLEDDQELENRLGLEDLAQDLLSLLLKLSEVPTEALVQFLERRELCSVDVLSSALAAFFPATLPLSIELVSLDGEQVC